MSSIATVRLFEASLVLPAVSSHWSGLEASEQMGSRQRLFAGASGCPFGPLALTAWTAAALRKVKSSAPLSRVRVKVYMDDKSFISTSTQGLLSAVSDWAAWSQSVGLRESPSKLQLSASSPSKLSLLEGVAPANTVSADFTSLGCSAAVSRRKLSKKEFQRVSDCLRIIVLAWCLPITF